MGDLDFREYLDAHRWRKVMVISADCENANDQPEEYACGICGFVTNEAKECPRRKVPNERDGHVLDERKRPGKQLGDDIDGLFDGGSDDD